ERLVHRLHTHFFLPGLHGRVDLVDLVFTNQIPDAGRRYHDLERHDAASSSLRQQGLTNDSLEDERQLRPNLALLVRREDIDDAVDRLRRRVGVKSGQRQVAGFRDTEGRFDRLEVAHFADENDVRVFAQRSAQRVRKALGVAVDLTLVDETALMLVDELDRVLDGEDVIVAFLVDLVDHRGKRRRLAGSGR